MGRQSPPPPESWAAEREKNRADRAAEPVAVPMPTEKPDLRTYKVVGPKAVFDTEPGATFQRDLSEGQERALVDAGHIAVVDNSAPESSGADENPGNEPVVKED